MLNPINPHSNMLYPITDNISCQKPLLDVSHSIQFSLSGDKNNMLHIPLHFNFGSTFKSSIHYDNQTMHPNKFWT